MHNSADKPAYRVLFGNTREERGSVAHVDDFDLYRGAEADRRAAEKVLQILKKKKKGSQEVIKEQLRMAKKETMRTVQHFLCDGCDAPIMKPKDGFVVQGNIYLADPSQDAGLIGNNFPETTEPFAIDAVHKTVLCKKCFLIALGLDNQAELLNVLGLGEQTRKVPWEGGGQSRGLRR